MNIKKLFKLRKKRAARVRYVLHKRATEDRKRLTVFRSNKHIYCQVIDPKTSNVLAHASTLEADLKNNKDGNKMISAQIVGQRIAERALLQGISKVFFDRSWYAYRGRVLSVADAARVGGLVF